MTGKRYFENLINFENCIQFKNLHLEMGITEYPKISIPEFKREVKETKKIIEISPEEKAIEEELTTSEIDLQFNEISTDNNFLTFSGRKVVAYIRDQPHVSIVHYGVDLDRKFSGYKYHLCNCKTLQDMTAEGRDRRYFVTKRSDGYFLVNCISRSNIEVEEAYVCMQLCGNCKKMLASMGVSMYNFSLKKFFEEHDSYIPETITKYENSTHIQDYSDDHAAVAATCKKEVNYTCQKCGVRCAGNRHLLHLHHKNGDKFDNYPSNLLVLCVECHSREPKHDHLRKQFRDEIDLISKLRKEQDILDLIQH